MGDIAKRIGLIGVSVASELLCSDGSSMSSAPAAAGSLAGAPGPASEAKPPDVWTSGGSEVPARPGVVQAGEVALAALRGPDSGSSIMDAQACIIALEVEEMLDGAVH